MRYGRQKTAEDYKAAVVSAAKWIDSQELSDEYGITWKRSNRPYNEIYTNPESFHTGTAGMIPYLLAVYDITEEKKYIDKAIAVGDRLIATKDLESTRNLGFHVAGSPWSIYGGLPGEAAAVLMLYEKTKIERFKEFVLGIADEIVADQRKTERGVEWYGKDNFSLAGDGGIILFLIYVARHLDTHAYDDTIRQAVEQVLPYGQPDKKGGTWWNGVEGTRAFGKPGTYWPGIEWGTAGLAYIFAECYDYLGDKRYMEAALAGEKHIINIADEVGDNAYLVYMNTDNRDLYYLGHCFGAMGIIKMFYKLDQVDDNPIHYDWIEKLCNGILSTGAPAVRSRGYWNLHCYCCGTTGLLSLFVALYERYKEPVYLGLAQDTADVLLGNGFNDDNKGLRWYQNWDRIYPEDVYTYNGYIVGNAGNTAHLVQLYSALTDNFHAYRFVEEPFL